MVRNPSIPGGMYCWVVSVTDLRVNVYLIKRPHDAIFAGIPGSLLKWGKWDSFACMKKITGKKAVSSCSGTPSV
jgi:hypothetical protein